jgi:Na+-translocating ferredoxin:NAD+ oxidoreductase subunit G
MELNMIKTMLRPALILTILCVVITAALAFTNLVTAPVIKQTDIENATTARKEVLPAADSFNEIKNTSDSVESVYEGFSNKKSVGYVITSFTKGYGGNVFVMTGIKSDLTISSVKLLSNNETPGLGKKAENKTFTDQYKLATNGIALVLTKKDKKDGEILAITGATITSKAVTDAVNDAIELAKTLEEK